MDHALVIVVGMVRIHRRLESDAVDGNRQLICSVDGPEDIIEVGVLAVVPHRLVVIHLNHADRANDVAAIPRLRIVRISAGVAPDVRYGGPEILFRQHVMDDYVTIPSDVISPLGRTPWIVPFDA